MIAFLTILARFGVPSWGHLGSIFGRNWLRSFDPDKVRVPRPSQNRPKTPSRPNLDQKSSKSRPKSTKNRPKIDQKSINIEAWRGSGRILAAKRVLRGVLGFLGGLLGRLGGLFGRLGSKKLAHMAPTWLPKRSQNRSNLDQRRGLEGVSADSVAKKSTRMETWRVSVRILATRRAL